MAARSKAQVYGRSPAEVVGSNPTGGMDVCLLWVLCCQAEVSATDWSLAQRSLTDCGAPLCVIKKPRKRGGYSPAGGLQNTNPQWVVATVEKNAMQFGNKGQCSFTVFQIALNINISFKQCCHPLTTTMTVYIYKPNMNVTYTLKYWGIVMFHWDSLMENFLFHITH